MLRTTIIAAAFVVAGPALAQETATATLATQDGTEVGTVTVTFGESGNALITLEGTGMPAGEHGFHVHETGTCEGDFSSAGGHLAGGKEHGTLAAGGQHVGDMPNVTVGEDGSATFEAVAVGLTPDLALDEDGSAVMVHGGADDYATQPSGDSGERIACGVLAAQG